MISIIKGSRKPSKIFLKNEVIPYLEELSESIIAKDGLDGYMEENYIECECAINFLQERLEDKEI
jgi:hypothetical protein